MAEVVDTPWNAAPFISELKAAGVRTVIRYINHRNSRALPEKRLERPEAEALSSAGLTLATVFQQNARRMADFARPERDAGRAFAHAAGGVGQPPGSAIYFAVDHDFYRADDLAAIRRYFEGIARARDAEPAARRYAVGAYGSGAVLSMLTAAGLIEHGWLALARGWSGTEAYDAEGRWALRQDRTARIGGLDVDDNTVGAAGAFGAFSVGSEAAREPARRSVIARRGLRLRAAPSLAGRILAVLPFGARVDVVKREHGWAEVDVDGDGAPDGHVCVAFLSST